MDDVELVGFEFEDHRTEVEVMATLYRQRPITAAEAEWLSDELSRDIGRPTRVRLMTIPITEVEAPPR